MTSSTSERNGRRSSDSRPRVGFFGLLGSGNLGNDASLEVMMTYLARRHPEAAVDAMCMGPTEVTSRHGIRAIPLQWSAARQQGVGRARAVVLKVLGKFVDPFRTASWVRRHDVVIVPGMGVMETSLPLRASGVPYAMFLLCVFGRLFRTKVALVSVGATTINQRMIRWLFDSAAKLAYYRSYRDVSSREAMRSRGIDTSEDRVFPDLVFGLRTPPPNGPGDARTVGVGVMAFHGDNDDRQRAEEIHRHYVDAMTTFVHRLVDDGYRIRLFWGDVVDEPVVAHIVDDLRSLFPHPGVEQVTARPFTSLRHLITDMAPCGAVVATRYHNVLSALKLSKPTLAVGYSSKHEALMDGMGVPELSLSARSVTADDLVRHFTSMMDRSEELRARLARSNEAMARGLAPMFGELDTFLFDPTSPPTPVVRAPALAGSGGRLLPTPATSRSGGD